MKKYLKVAAVLLSAIMLFGCGQKAEEANTTNQEATKQVQPQQKVKKEYNQDPDAIKIVVDGKQVMTSSPPESREGTTMVPFRDIFNALGVSDDEIQWNQAEQSVYVEHNGSTVLFYLGQKYANGGGKSVELSVAPYVNKNGDSMVPARFIAESMGAIVNWVGESRTVDIKSR